MDGPCLEVASSLNVSVRTADMRVLIHLLFFCLQIRGTVVGWRASHAAIWDQRKLTGQCRSCRVGKLSRDVISWPEVVYRSEKI